VLLLLLLLLLQHVSPNKREDPIILILIITTETVIATETETKTNHLLMKRSQIQKRRSLQVFPTIALPLWTTMTMHQNINIVSSATHRTSTKKEESHPVAMIPYVHRAIYAFDLSSLIKNVPFAKHPTNKSLLTMTLIQPLTNINPLPNMKNGGRTLDPTIPTGQTSVCFSPWLIIIAKSHPYLHSVVTLEILEMEMEMEITVTTLENVNLQMILPNPNRQGHSRHSHLTSQPHITHPCKYAICASHINEISSPVYHDSPPINSRNTTNMEMRVLEHTKMPVGAGRPTKAIHSVNSVNHVVFTI